ncbi:hypothetical protein SEA_SETTECANDELA_184 [Mycobacterium phage Settecandela]|nr:hypothetical protein SEA_SETTECANDELA_184 [Mycobacterium phage Settecandela]
MTTSLSEKVAKLLNQAERAGTEAEAEVFMAKAQELATLHSIDLAKARHATAAKERTTPVQRTITLGVRGTRGLNTLVDLFSGIAASNDIKLNIAHNSTYVIAFGFAEDIDVAEALYASLTVQMANAAAEYRKTEAWRKDTVWVPGRWRLAKDGLDEWVDGRHKPISWLTARLDFQKGFAVRVGQRLRAARKEAEARAAFEEAMFAEETTAGTALVLVEKREAVNDFYRQESRARGTYRGGRRTASHSAHYAGVAAGDRASLSRSTAVGGARKAIA